VVTAASTPFTAQFARAMVPSSAWNTPEFLALNRRISLAWGYAVLVLGACHLVAAYLELHHIHPIIRLLVAWAVPILALLRVIAYTRRAAEQHAPSPQPERNGS
jgi:membrane protein DedA with SNARE-associated domain